MATNYPNSLDSLTNPATTDPVNNPSHAIQHANANDAIEALQAKVGTDNSAVTTSIDYRVRQLELNPVTSTADKIEQTVVNGGATTLLKGQVVYVSGSVGASGKLRVSLSSNAAESTSTKTFGILAENIIAGGEGLLVSEGLLEGIDTTGAADGDPVFLGSTPGSLLFGLANKPVAPAHLVFLGIVVRGGQANTGSIFVKIQNGFELDELHDVLIVSKTGNDILSYDSDTGLWKNKSFNTLGLATQTYVDTAVQNLSNASDLEYVPIADVGQIDGVASLDSTGNVPLSQLGNLVDGAPTALDTLNELAAALGDNPNYATDITTALGNKVSKSGGSTIIPSTGSVAGLSFTPATGQTANLLEFIGGPSGGGVKVGPGGNIFDAPGINANYALTATAGGSGVVPVTIKGASGQTANLQEWRNSSGSVLAYVRNDGLISNSAMLSNYLWLGGFQSGVNLGITPNVLNEKALVIKGLASQTANLTEWQNSSGTVLASIDSAGSFNLASGKQVIFNNGLGTRLNFGYGSSYIVGIDDYAIAFGVESSTGLGKIAVRPATATYGSSYINPIELYGNGQIKQNLTIPSNVGLSIKAAASQTANLQEWQNSSGTVLANIASTGQINANAGFYTDWAGVGSGRIGSAHLSVAAQYLGNIVSIFKGASGQTANLTEWQNSAGSTLAYMDPNGNFVANYVGLGLNAGLVAGGSYFLRVNYAAGNTINLGTSAQVTGTQVQVTNSTASNIALTVKGAASQTSNLQEWQLSDGTVIASISKLNPNNNSAYLYVGGGADWKVGSNELHFGRSGGTAYINHPTSFTISSVYGGSLNIKGAASQTANLQEWQNSSGTVLTKVDSSGEIYLINPTANNNSNDTPSPAINFQGNIWNSAYGNQNIKGAIKVAAYNANINPTISKMSFLLATDNGTPAEVASFTNTGAFSNIGGLDAYGTGVIFRLRNTTNATTLVVSPSPKLELMGRAWNSSQGSTPTRAYLQVNANNNNDDPFINRLGFFVATGNNAGGWIYGADATEYMSVLGNGTVGINSTTPSGTLDVRSISASTIGAVVRGAASQTANLQEWQNSGGTVLANIDATGRFLSTRPFRTDDVITAGSQTSTLGQISAISSSSTRIGLVIRGAASQTANLQEWQDSAGTVYAFINPYGQLSIGQFPTIYSNARISLNTVAASVVGMVIRGVASQTGDLQQWQNSSGTVLASISAAGNLTVQDLTVNGTTTTINSTTLTVDDKNIELASVASPTDTTADGAGITIKGATDKTFNWVQSTGAFTSSEPISAPGISITGNSVSSNITLVSGKRYFVDTSAARTLTLPASPSLGDEIQVFDASGTAATNNVTINSNSGKINGSVQNAVLDVNGGVMAFIYTGSTYGWRAG